MARIEAEHPDIVLLDVNLPTGSGVEVLERLKATHPSLPVVMLTASREVKTAVRATQLGAFDYLTKPIDHDEIVAVVRRALDARALHLEVEDLRRRVNKNDTDQLAVEMGPSAPIKEVLEQVALVAASTLSVHCGRDGNRQGARGAGDPSTERAPPAGVHRSRLRRRFPSRSSSPSCSATKRARSPARTTGKRDTFGWRQGGTCSWTKSAICPRACRRSCSRVLESREVRPVGGDRATPVDVRFIAATNDDLAGARTCRRRSVRISTSASRSTRSPSAVASAAGGHRAPRAALPGEASVELRRPVQQLAPAALEQLQRGRWPGNVRELRNVIRQAVLRSKAWPSGHPIYGRC